MPNKSRCVGCGGVGRGGPDSGLGEKLLRQNTTMKLDGGIGCVGESGGTTRVECRGRGWHSVLAHAPPSAASPRLFRWRRGA